VSFIHDDRDFDALLRIVADKRKIAVGLVEKDYWVTHVLWSLQRRGFDVWFKGGTSLSKGFALIERFSEDLDLKLEPGSVNGIPPVTDWKRESTKATTARETHLRALAGAIVVPGAVVNLDPDLVDEHWRSVNVRAVYPGKHLESSNGVLKPFVLLEIGSARVTPSVACDMTSFVHEELAAQQQLDAYDDNRPKQVRCVHPLVTLLEKIDALVRRVTNQDREPATFVRHYEDAARIVANAEKLPSLDGYPSPRELADEMVQEKQIRALPSPEHPAFVIPANERGEAIRAAFTAIGPMFWGPRRTLDECTAAIRGWLEAPGIRVQG
jgi:hypothetical protein